MVTSNDMRNGREPAGEGGTASNAALAGESKPAGGRKPAGEGNAYESNARGVLQLYGAFVEGTPDCTLAVVSSAPLSQQARSALRASAERLGYGEDACAWIVLANEAGELGASDVLSVVEGLDPFGVVATDARAVAQLSAAFDTSMKVGASNRAACRTVAALADFEAALQDAEAKQKAWSVLKRLAR